MKSYFLEGLASREVALMGLRHAFPNQVVTETAVVFAPSSDSPISWLYVTEPDDPEEQDGPFLIQADVTGRRYDFGVDELVVGALRVVQARVGGTIRDDEARRL